MAATAFEWDIDEYVTEIDVVNVSMGQRLLGGLKVNSSKWKKGYCLVRKKLVWLKYKIDVEE